MEDKRYPTDLSDAEWKHVGPHLPGPKGRGRPKMQGSRAILDAVLLRPKKRLPAEATAEGLPALEERLLLVQEVAH